MNVSIQFPPAIESALIRRAAAAGMDLSAFVTEVVTEAVAEELQPEASADSAVRRAALFRERLDRWTALHPALDHVIDDSRDALYDGRGE